MSSRAMLVATAQAAALGAVSSVLAQLITASRSKAELSIDWLPVTQFVLFSVVSNPPNLLWEEYLESTYPAHPRPAARPASRPGAPPMPPPPPLSVRNTLAKLALDQTVGAAANTLLFGLFKHALRDAMAPAPRLASLPAALAHWARPVACAFRRPALLVRRSRGYAAPYQVPLILAGHTRMLRRPRQFHHQLSW